MTRHGSRAFHLTVDVERVFIAFAHKLTIVRFKMSDEIAPLHAA